GGALALPHLAARRRGARRLDLGAIGRERRRRDDGAPVHEAVVAVQHGPGERFRAEAGELGGEHEREERRVATRGTGGYVERVVAELALDVLGQAPPHALDTIGGSHSLQDPRRSPTPHALPPLRP